MKPYIIAELGANAGGSLDYALRLVDAAADCGCDAIKLQTYTPDCMTLDEPYFASGLWQGKTLYELYAEAMTPWDWHEPIFAKARLRGLGCISTPFSFGAVDFLDKIGVDAYKVASFECNWYDLIARIGAKRKPVYISTGMASVGEIVEAWRTVVVASCGAVKPVLLHCLSAYPAALDDMHLANMTSIKSFLPTAQVGLSDHTLGVVAAMAATALGAVAIEKHFVMSRDDGGPDAAFSTEPMEMCRLVDNCRAVARAIGEPKFGGGAGENPYYRRSIIATKDIAVGEMVCLGNVGVLRPNIGLEPGALDEVIGKKVTQPVRRGEGLQWQHLR